MGDLRSGLFWMMQPGTYQQYLDGIPLEERTWSVMNKLLIMILFSSMGFFGSSCSAAITKNFGALTMSITSTARKAMTLFLSFFLFNNVCTTEHIVGIVIFIVALTTKSLRRRNKTVDKNRRKKDRELKRKQSSYPSSEMVSSLIVNIKPNETTPDQLTYRQRNSSGDGIDVTTMQNNTRSNLVHVV